MMQVCDTYRVTGGRRQSNIELLRIVAMLFVLIVHACFLPFGSPSAADICARPVTTSMFILTEFFAIVGVNVFVLISGWFGIHPSIRGFFKLMFQSMFFLIGAYIIEAFFDFGLESHGLMRLIQSLTGSAAWFIPSYVGLYIFSPLLNTWIEQSSERTLRRFLICFFMIEFVYGFVPSDPPSYFTRGYSAISFMGLYCLARYIRLYGRQFCARYGNIVMYVIACVANSLIYIYISLSRPEFCGHVLSYINPITIFASCCLLISFSKMKISYSKVINWISASSFGVYLLNAGFAKTYDFYAYMLGTRYGVIGVALFVLCVFLIGIMMDQPRKFLWGRILRFTKNWE